MCQHASTMNIKASFFFELSSQLSHVSKYKSTILTSVDISQIRRSYFKKKFES